MTVLDHAKEILGVDNAQYVQVCIARSRTHHLTLATPPPWAGLLWLAVMLDRARVGEPGRHISGLEE